MNGNLSSQDINTLVLRKSINPIMAEDLDIKSERSGEFESSARRDNQNEKAERKFDNGSGSGSNTASPSSSALHVENPSAGRGPVTRARARAMGIALSGEKPDSSKPRGRPLKRAVPSKLGYGNEKEDPPTKLAAEGSHEADSDKPRIDAEQQIRNGREAVRTAEEEQRILGVIIREPEPIAEPIFRPTRRRSTSFSVDLRISVAENEFRRKLTARYGADPSPNIPINSNDVYSTHVKDDIQDAITLVRRRRGQSNVVAGLSDPKPIDRVLKEQEDQHHDDRIIGERSSDVDAHATDKRDTDMENHTICAKVAEASRGVRSAADAGSSILKGVSSMFSSTSKNDSLDLDSILGSQNGENTTWSASSAAGIRAVGRSAPTKNMERAQSGGISAGQAQQMAMQNLNERGEKLNMVVDATENLRNKAMNMNMAQRTSKLAEKYEKQILDKDDTANDRLLNDNEAAIKHDDNPIGEEKPSSTVRQAARFFYNIATNNMQANVPRV